MMLVLLLWVTILFCARVNEVSTLLEITKVPFTRFIK